MPTKDFELTGPDLYFDLTAIVTIKLNKLVKPIYCAFVQGSFS